MQQSKHQKGCPVFLRWEDEIRILIDKMSRSDNIAHKAGFADKMDGAVTMLLSCRDYDGQSRNCISCHTVSILRKMMAKLVQKEKIIFGKQNSLRDDSVLSEPTVSNSRGRRKELELAEF